MNERTRIEFEVPPEFKARLLRIIAQVSELEIGGPSAFTSQMKKRNIKNVSMHALELWMEEQEHYIAHLLALEE